MKTSTPSLPLAGDSATHDDVIDVTSTAVLELPPEKQTALIDVEFVRLGEYKLATYRDVLIKASDVATELGNIIKERKLFKVIQGKEFVYVEGWTTCGGMMGVVPRAVSVEENPKIAGEFIAVVEAVRASDEMVLARGFASCGPDERDWANRSRQARRSMSQTRATGKAMRLLFSWIMSLAGYEPTPLEEADGEIGPPRYENPEPRSDAPQTQTRDSRKKPPVAPLGPAPSAQDVGWVCNEFKKKHPTKDKEGFKAWVLETTKRAFDVGWTEMWTAADISSCCIALGVPTLKELTEMEAGQ